MTEKLIAMEQKMKLNVNTSAFTRHIIGVVIPVYVSIIIISVTKCTIVKMVKMKQIAVVRGLASDEAIATMSPVILR